jgi:hypothetical protein
LLFDLVEFLGEENPMSGSSFVTTGIWKSISSAAKRSDAPVYASVAYFGKGASRLLRLPKNSRLVVDASIAAVKSGQTCPADLRSVQKRGVRIYSIPNLHAKVYVFGGVAFIGSANASNHSAGTLIEAVIQTADKGIMRSAREFVRGLCLDELGPERLDHLAKLYRPPRFANGAKRSVKKRGISPELPRLLLAQLENLSPPSETKATMRDGLESAKEKRKHGRNYVFDYFWWRGNFPYKVGDKVIQVTEENSRLSLVAPPADIVHLAKWRRGTRRVTFAYYEHPKMRRLRLEKLARRIGYGAKKRLQRDGLVRNKEFAEKLLAVFGG